MFYDVTSIYESKGANGKQQQGRGVLRLGLDISRYMMILLGFRDRASSGNTCIEKYTRNRRIGGKTCMGFFGKFSDCKLNYKQ